MPLFRSPCLIQDLENALFDSHKSLEELVLESQQQLACQTRAAAAAADGPADAAVVETLACPYTVSDLASFLHQQRSRSTSLESASGGQLAPAKAAADNATSASAQPLVTVAWTSDLARSPYERESRTSTTGLAPALITADTVAAHGLCGSGSLSMPLEPVSSEQAVAPHESTEASYAQPEVADTAAADALISLSTSTIATVNHPRPVADQQQSTTTRNRAAKLGSAKRKRSTAKAAKNSKPRPIVTSDPDPSLPEESDQPSVPVPVTGDMPPSGLLQNLSNIATAVVPSYAAETCSSPATLAAVASIIDENEETGEQQQQQQRASAEQTAIAAVVRRKRAASDCLPIDRENNNNEAAEEEEEKLRPKASSSKRQRRRAPTQSSEVLPGRYTALQVPRFQPRIVASTPPPSSGLVSTRFVCGQSAGA